AMRSPGSGALSLTSERIGERPPGTTDPAHPLVLAALEATRLIGRTPELAVGSSDANIPMSLGIPAIALGAGGSGGDTHTLREWYDNTHATLGLVRALVVIAAAAGRA
ncbi:MAG: M20/M25/M40 family metallo-hydrolase, partial [Gemmatimonadaceae bacterium]